MVLLTGKLTAWSLCSLDRQSMQSAEFILKNGENNQGCRFTPQCSRTQVHGHESMVAKDLSILPIPCLFRTHHCQAGRVPLIFTNQVP